MKLLAPLVALIGPALFIAVRLYVQNRLVLFGKKINPNRMTKKKCYIQPRRLESGGRQIFIVRPGEPDYLFWTEGDMPHSYDEAMLEAEIQAREFNRLRRERLRELKA